MAISLVGTAEDAATTDFDLTLPTLAENDVVYLFVAQIGTGIGLTDPNGFTELFNSTDVVDRFVVLRKVMGATPDTTVTIDTATVSRTVIALAVCLRGVDTTTPEDATTTGTTTATSSTNPDSASITTVTNGAWVISAFRTAVGDTTVTAPSGYTNQVDHTLNALTAGAATKEVATAGAEDPASWTNVSSGSWYAATIAVRPAGAAAAVPPGGRLIGGILTRPKLVMGRLH